MRTGLGSLAAFMLAVGLLGCGSSEKHAPPRKAGSKAPTVSAEAAALIGAHARFEWRYLNDRDHENPRDPDQDHLEDDDTDSRFHENTRYLDADDTTVITFGHSAPAAEIARVRAIVKRYYALAAAGDGSAACRQLVPQLVIKLPFDYGREGPSYVRGSKTCGEVLTRVFEHSHFDFSAPYEVTDVRVANTRGIAVLGSAKARPSFISLEQEQGTWDIAQLLPRVMP